MKKFVLIMSMLLLIAVLASCGTTGYAAKKAEDTGKTIDYIDPHTGYESCLEASPDKVITYSFTSSEPLNFNLHYHENGDVQYPVKKNQITSDSGTYHPELTTYFCLMWTNKSEESIRIEFEHLVK